jgi:hypothetical protein
MAETLACLKVINFRWFLGESGGLLMIRDDLPLEEYLRPERERVVGEHQNIAKRP